MVSASSELEYAMKETKYEASDPYVHEGKLVRDIYVRGSGEYVATIAASSPASQTADDMMVHTQIELRRLSTNSQLKKTGWWAR